jgi:Protein of unknown function (DUF1453)
MAHPPYYWLALAPLVYIRIRRSIGYRKFTGRRLLIPMALFFVMVVAIGIVNWGHSISLVTYSVGGMLGAALGGLAVRETRFQWREESLYFRTHIWIQVTILAVFLLRMTYRLYALAQGENHPESPDYGPMEVFQDPLTAGIACMLFMHNLVYLWSVFRQGVQLVRAGNKPAMVG